MSTLPTMTLLSVEMKKKNTTEFNLCLHLMWNYYMNMHDAECTSRPTYILSSIFQVCFLQINFQQLKLKTEIPLSCQQLK